jgi:hypothetical protein
MWLSVCMFCVSVYTCYMCVFEYMGVYMLLCGVHELSVGVNVYVCVHTCVRAV